MFTLQPYTKEAFVTVVRERGLLEAELSRLGPDVDVVFGHICEEGYLLLLEGNGYQIDDLLECWEKWLV